MFNLSFLSLLRSTWWAMVVAALLGLTPPPKPNLANLNRQLWKQKIYGKLPLLWAHEVTYTPEALTFMSTLQQKNYPFHATAIGLGMDGFPEQHLSPLRIDPQLVESIAAEKGELEEQLRRHLRPEDLDFSYPYEELADFRYVFENYSGFKKQLVVEKKLRRLRAFHRELERNTHGAKVISLILGEAPMGASVDGKLTHLLLDTSHHGFYSLGTTPDIINFSTSAGTAHVYDNEYDYMELFHQLSAMSEETIFVLAAGNDGTTFDCREGLYTACTISGRNPIVVGGVSPTGHASDYSNYGEPITILAGGEFMPSIDAQGEIERMEGTSFAAPQVTAALANVIAILPSLTGAEAQHMLKMTATPTAAKATGVDGAGVLNHYLLLRAAHRIAQAAEQGDKSVHELIFTAAMYDFSDEAAKLAADSLTILVGDAVATATDNHLSFIAAIDRILMDVANTSPASLAYQRKAAALDPTNTELRQKLASMYSKGGYHALSMFYGDPHAPATVALESPLISFLRKHDSREFIRENLNAKLVSQYLLPLVNRRIFSLSQDSAWRDFFVDPYDFAGRYAADQQTLTAVIATLLQAKQELNLYQSRLSLDLDYERRMKRSFPVHDGEPLNLVEWAILTRNENLLEQAYEKIEAEYDDIVRHEMEHKEKDYSPRNREDLVAEITAYIIFVIEHSQDAEILDRLLHLRSSIVIEKEFEFLHSLHKDNQDLLHDKPHFLKILQKYKTKLKQ